MTVAPRRSRRRRSARAASAASAASAARRSRDACAAPTSRCCAADRCSRRAPRAGRGGVRRCRLRWTPRRRCSTGATKVLLAPVRRARRPRCGACSDSVVVGEDRARPDVAALADLGVTDVRQVRHLGAFAEVGLLGLDERADLALAPETVPGRHVGERPDADALAEHRAVRRVCGRPWRPRPTSTSVRVRVRSDHGAGRRRRVCPCSWTFGPQRDVRLRARPSRRPRSWRGRRPRRPSAIQRRASGR